MATSKKKEEKYQQVSEMLAGTARQVSRQVNLELPPAHSREQYELINGWDLYPGTRFMAGACGTKFGKTYGTALRMITEAWNNPASLNWWVSPTYRQATKVFRHICSMLPKNTYESYVSDRRIVIVEPDGTEHSVIEFLSAENPDSLRGDGVNFAVVDEAARCSYESWVSVFTTLTKTQGRAMIISTPKGRGWFYDLYMRGVKFNDDGTPRFGVNRPDPHPEWRSVCLPTWINPTVPIESIEEMRRNLPEDVFRQEVAAKFLLESAGVFKNIRGCARASYQRYIPGHSYVIGVDLARLRDFTVLTVMDRENHNVVHIDRFNSVEWTIQKLRIIALAKAYGNATVVPDSTGVGDPIVEDLEAAGLIVHPYKIGGSAAKQQLIEKLRVDIEQGRISYPPDVTLIDELETFEYEVTKRGMFTYSSPYGKHDDMVISLAFCCQEVSTEPYVIRYTSLRGI